MANENSNTAEVELPDPIKGLVHVEYVPSPRYVRLTNGLSKQRAGFNSSLSVRSIDPEYDEVLFAVFLRAVSLAELYALFEFLPVVSNEQLLIPALNAYATENRPFRPMDLHLDDPPLQADRAVYALNIGSRHLVHRHFYPWGDMLFRMSMLEDRFLRGEFDSKWAGFPRPRMFSRKKPVAPNLPWQDGVVPTRPMSPRAAARLQRTYVAPKPTKRLPESQPKRIQL